MNARLQPGDVILIKDMPAWNDCLLLVEEIRNWGVKGKVQGFNGATYPMRVAHECIAATWRPVLTLPRNGDT